MNVAIKQLQQLTSDNKEQQKRIALLQDLINKRVAIFQKVISSYQKQNLNTALELVAYYHGNKITSQIKSVYQKIKQEEQKLLKTRNDNLATHSFYTNLFILGCNIFNIILFLIIFTLFTRQLNARIKAEIQTNELQHYLKGIIEGSNDLIAAIDINYRYITSIKYT